MGRYTEFIFESDLENGMPEVEANLLKSILIERRWKVDENNEWTKPPIAHTFFDCPRWLMLLVYTDFDSNLKCSLEIYKDGKMRLNIHSRFKNYDNEIRLFLDWIRKYVKTVQPNSNLGWYQVDEEEKIYIDFLSFSRRFIFKDTEGYRREEL